MSSAIKNWVRSLLPDPIHRWWRHRFGWQWFRGDYPSWAEARAASNGYETDSVLERVVQAVRQTRAKPSLWERDGYVFAHSEPNPELVAALRAATRGDQLTVVDFGGSLGSTWWQHRAQFADLSVSWRVVEQAHYVEAGAEFAGRTLSFHRTMADAVAPGDTPALLMSGVLPYIPDPQSILAEALALKFGHIILDRTPVAHGRRRLAVQHTLPELGGATYPVWLLPERELLAMLFEHYQLVSTWDSLDDLAADVAHRGYHFRRVS